jgi:hypothetical protein
MTLTSMPTAGADTVLALGALPGPTADLAECAGVVGLRAGDVHERRGRRRVRSRCRSQR